MESVLEHLRPFLTTLSVPAPAWLVILMALLLSLENRRLGRAVDLLIKKLVLRE